jgi:hypothetical protein
MLKGKNRDGDQELGQYAHVPRFDESAGAEDGREAVKT